MRLHQPIGKDQMRIYDMVRGAMPGGKRCNQYADPDRCNSFFLLRAARLMNDKITDQAKRVRRAEAAVHYGLISVAEVFSPDVARRNTFHPVGVYETRPLSERVSQQTVTYVPPAPVVNVN